jgi:hydroxyacylglutathione hydrolase
MRGRHTAGQEDRDGRDLAVRVHAMSLGLARGYLIECDRGLMLVDTGSPGQEGAVLRRLAALGREDLRLILVTHAHLDHYGSAAALRQRTGAPVAIHRADAEAMACGETRLGEARGWGWVVQQLLPAIERALRPEPVAADLLLEGGENLEPLGLPGQVLHTPGHTPGSCCLAIEGQVAFVGDLLSTTGRPHVQRRYAQDWALLAQSLARLERMELERAYPGHGPRSLGGAALRRLLSSACAHR